MTDRIKIYTSEPASDTIPIYTVRLVAYQEKEVLDVIEKQYPSGISFLEASKDIMNIYISSRETEPSG